MGVHSKGLFFRPSVMPHSSRALRHVSVLLLGLYFHLVHPIHLSAQTHGQDGKGVLYKDISFQDGTTIRAEIADRPETRQRGLMFRDRLPAGSGMLFIFPQAEPYRFWMKNCKFPLDILWLNAQKEIVYISANTSPCLSDPCPQYGPTQDRALYVLEVAAGFVKKTRLQRGMRVQF